LLDVVAETFTTRLAARYAHVVGCVPLDDSGSRPLVAGSTIPGFRVAHIVPRRELVLSGHHRFSEYTLTFRVQVVHLGTTRLSAETRAAFPGVHGRVYRALVVGTGIHGRAVRRLLDATKRRATVRASCGV
jgi:hypothetical protein